MTETCGDSNETQGFILVSGNFAVSVIVGFLRCHIDLIHSRYIAYFLLQFHKEQSCNVDFFFPMKKGFGPAEGHASQNKLND